MQRCRRRGLGEEPALRPFDHERRGLRRTAREVHVLEGRLRRVADPRVPVRGNRHRARLATERHRPCAHTAPDRERLERMTPAARDHELPAVGRERERDRLVRRRERGHRAQGRGSPHIPARLEEQHRRRAPQRHRHAAVGQHQHARRRPREHDPRRRAAIEIQHLQRVLVLVGHERVAGRVFAEQGQRERAPFAATRIERTDRDPRQVDGEREVGCSDSLQPRLRSVTGDEPDQETTERDRGARGHHRPRRQSVAKCDA